MSNSNVFGKFQKLGKSLMLPIAVMPVVAIFLRLGVLWNLPFITAAGSSVFNNLPVLFAIGVAIGFAKDGQGSAGLAGAVGYFTLDSCAKAINADINMGVLAGMIAGILAGNLYNKYHDIKLPDFLGFFGGKRFVPIITSVCCIMLGLVFGYIWPYVGGGIDSVGNWIIGTGSIGLFVFGLLNRLLIPTGLHHIMNNIVWFIFGNYNGVTGDLNRFLAGDASAGMFMTGFFPIMMFGLPAAALAMYTTAKKENKKAVAGVLASVAFTAFLTGITEPLEFMFMFIAPALYLVHAVLTGISMALTYTLGIHHGFGFSAGAIDYIINMNLATKGWLLVPVGLVFGVIYYFVFVFAIKKFNIKTPGREDVIEENDSDNSTKKDNMDESAKAYLQALGGKENIIELDSCITRLRLTLKDTSIVDENKLKSLGASGVLKINDKNMQVIVGTKVELLSTRMKKLL
ncbi:N-acetylglucosamine-specific PTS transporter subunit IIBC [Tepidibacter formicigenes]|jgi:PTS system N-acetylglucosamine-specific IIC component|uniref:PTS system N-acetylglucosamine-specific IIB component, Glc family (TC 4.A.1.1.7)/PTS system N-acetylglucosamine-specific IIC component, Glc family (TC 4.A.1.1.7) n=1 Tax=Tepidibacter formicigenes DSM 15518 TaxID=1123349 RepID=A0A1M6PJG1_9FIRM|nr:N-acetylglucosamine-specific PTS transporter subunit IIBC [Tepidibacter formicigenes]SHK08063.1 PTS system N-acetylglucosamine-specific IIB component, Glc family (TC 4.A.1.1.7)/PTS system N-acetylglucosamine-specific IIC component, Glc family (TC 4.A.1.1.7) [Tepidibacter formicigenes DSM 15518]